MGRGDTKKDTVYGEWHKALKGGEQQDTMPKVGSKAAHMAYPQRSLLWWLAYSRGRESKVCSFSIQPPGKTVLVTHPGFFLVIQMEHLCP